MTTWLTEALDRGLELGHAERAVARVVEEGELDAHCAVLRKALQQARADQLAGMCPSCGVEPEQHLPDCAQAQGSWWDSEDRFASGQTADVAGLAELPASPPPSRPTLGPVDPLQILLDQPPSDLAGLSEDADKVMWIAGRFAHLIADHPDRETGLRTLWNHYRPKVTSHEAELVDQAVQHVGHVLRRRVS